MPRSATRTASNGPEFFEAESLPDGLSINGATGVISGTPQETGEFEVGLLAGNGAGIDLATLVLTVTNPGSTFAGWSGGATINVSVVHSTVRFPLPGPVLRPLSAAACLGGRAASSPA